MQKEAISINNDVLSTQLRNKPSVACAIYTSRKFSYPYLPSVRQLFFLQNNQVLKHLNQDTCHTSILHINTFSSNLPIFTFLLKTRPFTRPVLGYKVTSHDQQRLSDNG